MIKYKTKKYYKCSDNPGNMKQYCSEQGAMERENKSLIGNNTLSVAGISNKMTTTIKGGPIHPLKVIYYKPHNIFIMDKKNYNRKNLQTNKYKKKTSKTLF